MPTNRKHAVFVLPTLGLHTHSHTQSGHHVLICLAHPCCPLSQIQSGTPLTVARAGMVEADTPIGIAAEQKDHLHISKSPSTYMRPF